MKNYKGLLMTLMIALGFWGCAETTPKQELNVNRSEVISVTATVEKIDLKKRKVTIRGPEGNLMTILAGKEVVNLPQVRVGDKVEIDYVQSLAVRMAQPGEVRNETTEMMTRAKPGSKPGAAEVTETTVTATIMALDQVNETATLKGPEGDVVVVKVQDPANLKKVKVGDTIVITYTEAAAISVRGKK
jgi:Cu/Ag efflux protein CusF